MTRDTQYVTSSGVGLATPAPGPADVLSSSSRSRKRMDNIEPPSLTDSTADYSRWTALVERIQQGDETGMTELYDLFSRGVRFYLCRQLGAQELEDKVHDTFLIVVRAIQRGDLREPERLMGFVRTVARRQVAAHIDRVAQHRRDDAELDTGIPIADKKLNPEDLIMARQRVEVMKQTLQEISPRDREILTRFYLKEQSQEQICREMRLTETQFRLLKSRAKTRFGELGKKRLGSRSIGKFFVRASAQG